MAFAILTVRIPERTVLLPREPRCFMHLHLFLEQINSTTHYMTLLHTPSPAASTASGFSDTNVLNNVKSILSGAVHQNKDPVLAGSLGRHLNNAPFPPS